MDTPVIWVISSDYDTQRLIGLNLSRRGFHVLKVSPQDELISSWAKPHLIILDADLLDEFDWKIAKALRGSPHTQGVPLILLLTNALPPSQLALLQPAHWVKKPLAMDLLLASIRTSLA